VTAAKGRQLRRGRLRDDAGADVAHFLDLAETFTYALNGGLTAVH